MPPMKSQTTRIHSWSYVPLVTFLIYSKKTAGSLFSGLAGMKLPRERDSTDRYLQLSYCSLCISDCDDSGRQRHWLREPVRLLRPAVVVGPAADCHWMPHSPVAHHHTHHHPLEALVSVTLTRHCISHNILLRSTLSYSFQLTELHIYTFICSGIVFCCCCCCCCWSSSSSSSSSSYYYLLLLLVTAGIRTGTHDFW